MDTRRVARKIVEESVVLLKNDERFLPLSVGKKAAFFGRAQINTYFSGNGSGASDSAENLNILDECEKRGICAEPELKKFYQEQLAKENAEKPAFDFAKLKEAVNSGIMYELFGQYHAPEKEYEVPDEMLHGAAAFTDTAILVIGRNSGGEECDRHLEEDYYLTESERKLAEQVCADFDHVVLVLNINGLIDLAWVEQYESIKSILFLGICGEQGAAALADILIGKVNPSGKLPVTIARRYEDYPSAKHFSWNKECPDEILTYESYGLNAEENGSVGFEKSPVTVYLEDIYAGYRYFDTFHCEPLFPFGFGLSYTEFGIGNARAEKQERGLGVYADITNMGSAAGREVLQLYLSAAGTKSERPVQELKGFAKTDILRSGETEELRIFVPWRELAVYDEAKAAYVIEKGTYRIRIGNSSGNTREIAKICVEEDILTQDCQNRLGLQACNRDKLEFLSQRKDEAGLRNDSVGEEREGIAAFLICKEEVVDDGEKRQQKCAIDERSADGNTARESAEDDSKERDIIGKEAAKQDLQDFSIEELAALCVGYGPGTPFAALGDGNDPETIFDKEGRPLTTNSHPVGFNGYVSPAIERRGIQSVFYKDGPAGIGETAWPSEMLIACAFDRRLWREFGDAVGYECEKQQVDVWLAPAVNLHRNPLCGRNFEYLSEDPYLTGVCACEITHGVQDNHSVLVCPKHFAVNEQETYRRGSAKKNYDAADSILTERAARELYLKPFEMLVRENNVLCIMSSFNKINGRFAGGSFDLCNGILREEWGYQGVVVTDWGDMDIVVDGADAVAAGNDVVMPGGPPVIAQILAGYREGRVTRTQMETAVEHLLHMCAFRHDD